MWAIFWLIVQTVIVAGIGYGLGQLLQKKPKRDDISLEINQPTTELGRPFPICFGTPPRLTAPMVFWNGDLYIYEREREDVIVYRMYQWGAHLGLCLAEVDGVIQFWYGDKVAWPTVNDAAAYAADGVTTATVNARALYGGPYEGGTGGISGTIAIEYGGPAQARNAYLTAKIGPGPAMRGFVGLVCHPLFWGYTPYPQILGSVVKRTSILTDGDDQWYPEKSAIATYGLNAAHIIRECLTNVDWGDGRDPALMGATFAEVADDLFAENFGLSYWYEPGPGKLLPFLDELLETIDGYLYEDLATGIFEIGLCRGDYTVAALDAYDESDFEIVEFDRPGWGDIPGRVILTYRDRSWPDQRPRAIYEDLAVIAKQGDYVVEMEVDRPGILDAALANAAVARLGKAATARAAHVVLRSKRTMAPLHQGKVFKIAYNDPDLTIVQMVLRVMEIGYGSMADPYIEPDCIEDVWGAGYTVIANPPDTSWTPPEPTTEKQLVDVLEIEAEEAVFEIINEVEA